jgi:ribosomal-protein-alanine N-acetyltransferase
MDYLFRTPRLQARWMTEQDFDDVFRLMSDPDSMRYIRPPETDPQPVRERMAKWIAYGKNAGGLGCFILEWIENQRFAGYIVGRHVDFDLQSTEYEIGYTFAPEYWGQGLATEIILPLSRYVQAITGTNKVVAFIDPQNGASERVLLKNGFVHTGTRQIYDGISAELWLDLD